MYRLLILFLVVSSSVFAHDAQMRQSMFSDWMNQLRSKKGLCCTSNEGSTVKDVDWMVSDQGENPVTCTMPPIDAARTDNKPSKYCVRIDGQWWNVPEIAVIEEPNKYGPATVWPIWGSKNGGPKTVDGIRCFMPGTFS